jgi:hypothetical protein
MVSQAAGTAGLYRRVAEMTKPVTVTEAQITRAIRAAQKTGLGIKNVKINPLDGIIIVECNDAIPITPETPSDDKWADD